MSGRRGRSRRPRGAPGRAAPAATLARALAIAGAVVACACAVVACRTRAGDACDPGDAVCADPRTVLACRGAKYVAVGCGGPRGCFSPEPGAVACDDALADDGEACVPLAPPSAACSRDGTRALACAAGGAWKTNETCRAPRACHVRAGRAACD